MKRIYIPMPDADARRELLKHLLRGQPVRLSWADMERVVNSTAKYSASDLSALCREAAIIPIRCVRLTWFVWRPTNYNHIFALSC